MVAKADEPRKLAASASKELFGEVSNRLSRSTKSSFASSRKEPVTSPLRGAPLSLATACLALAAVGCVVGERPLALPGGDRAAVAVLSAGLGASMQEVGRHSWIAARRAGSTEWARFENGSVSRGRDPLEDPCSCARDRQHPDASREGAVRLHAVLEGDDAARAITCLEAQTERYDEHYRFWPGPNCNTYVERMARLCHLGVDLPATAYGKDFRGVAGISTTSGGTGIQLESILVGLKIGLTEGVEVHIVSLPIGVDVWPPALIVPIGPGRIGFDDR